MSDLRPVSNVTIKRCHLKLVQQSDDKYGHWWVEIGDPLDPLSQSYGWWPKQSVGFVQTFLGVQGELNATSRNSTPFRDPATGVAIRDPHHGDPSDESFSPLVRKSDVRTDEQIEDCIRSFALSYQGRWQWIFEAGKNCHTFQLKMMEHCQLTEPPQYTSRISRLKY